MSLRGLASWAKMMLAMGKLTAPACHLNKKVNSRVINLSLYKY
jgi:hypothetical protein